MSSPRRKNNQSTTRCESDQSAYYSGSRVTYQPEAACRLSFVIQCPFNFGIVKNNAERGGIRVTASHRCVPNGPI
ncbi:AAEL013100-PA [Aedes aegypti]|uniref:AAEL013100-PA n=1 Tax=Aedes aegypti TaxID=7159 RepID=Q16K64_AEDAE|nr:AAEL013100-PA [Aedes aegypti]